MNKSACDVADFWRTRYQENNTPWDLGEPASPFVHLLDGQGAQLPPGRIVVVGCGRGHDTAFFGRRGFDALGLDIAPEAIAIAKELYGDVASFEVADIFDSDLRYKETFDYVAEHTLFCAISPARRQAYVDAVYRLLKPGGIYIGILWAHNQPDGPPYKTTREEVLSFFEPFFKIRQLETTPWSIAERKNQELLGIFEKR